MVPGRPGTNMDLPRKPDEIRRDWARLHATGCKVKTDGARLEVTFPGLELGLFSGELQYTVYRGAEFAASGSRRQDGRTLRRLPV